MQVGAVFPFPLTEIGSDPATLREYVSAAEGVGYEHLSFPDHVIGVDPDRPGGWQAPYTHESPIHEPLITLSFIAAITERIGLSTGILILPQRQTVLVAKQTAALDVLSEGRLRLGVGLGWNAVEYGVLGENFGNRGRRIEEQIALLRAMWAEPSIAFEGRHHSVPLAGINPLPPRRSIPIWMGGAAEPVLDRIGRLADGWILTGGTRPEAVAGPLAVIRESARAAGRDPADIGLEAWIRVRPGDQSEKLELARAWADVGATHLSVQTTGLGYTSPAEHIAAITDFRVAWDADGA